MWDKIKQFVALPIFAADEDKNRAARLLNNVLWVLLITAVFGATILVVTEPSEALFNALFGVLFVGVIFGMQIWLWHGHVRRVGRVLVAALWLSVTYLVLRFGGLRGQVMGAHYLILIVAGAVLGSNPVLIIGALNIVLGLVLYIGESNGWISGLHETTALFVDWFIYTVPMALSAVLLSMGLRDIQRWIQRSLNSEQSLFDRNRELSESRQDLAAYTRDVERRSAYFEAAAHVTHAISGWHASATQGALLDADVLVDRLAQAMAEELQFEHVGIYLLTADRMAVVLRAASSEGGQRLVARGHTLTLMEVAALEAVVWRGEYYICRGGAPFGNGGADAVFLNNPELPDVRSALLLPLWRTHGREVLGMLELATAQSEAFDVQDAVVLQSLADQAALLIAQARLFAELQESLVAARQTSGQVSRESWGQLLRIKAHRVYRYLDKPEAVSIKNPQRAERIVLEEGDSAAESAAAALPELTLPLRVRDQVLGKLVAHKLAGRGDWTTEESMMMNTLLAQLEQALDSARMYNVTQRRAMREQVTRELTAHIRSSLTIEEAMRRAVREVAQVLRASETVARLGTEQTLLQNRADVDMGGA